MGLEFQMLDNLPLLESLLLSSVSTGGATVCGYISKKFIPHGVTTLVLLSESHASIHTYPECGFLFFDIFTCGNCQTDLILDALIDNLNPKTVRKSIIHRGA
ncbi:S-adenosylmethionine decarboxylase [Pseudomonas sp. NFACC23-1]|nr:S-adenosylmethionine decarboxylase [Pseudomonas sp. NFACC17-2]SEJ97322.1 S-adenosylmethionine decarboxylase [Pseudomonas sp. NFACC23-1]SFW92985.1 S-adenosylmethionine decarboxylase [Pseudomonas sp. NFACC16-2]